MWTLDFEEYKTEPASSVWLADNLPLIYIHIDQIL